MAGTDNVTDFAAGAEKRRESSSERTAIAHDESTPANKEQASTDPDEKIELTEEDCYDELGYSFPEWKKWTILSIIFMVQVSMNFNTSLYSNATHGISEHFHVSLQAARLGAALFLITYAFGCELWAPWSEELGRKWVLQASLGLVNIMQIPVALAPNFGTILAFRSLGGLCTAGGSVTLAMVADMWEADKQQYAVAFIVFSSVGGSVLGPIVGGFVEQYCAWQWNIWIQLIFGVFTQVIHLWVPETRSTIMMDNIAKKRRKSGQQSNIYGPNELLTFKERFSAKEIMTTWIRPFKMFLTEPIVLVLSLLSGFADALIFMFIQSFALVYDQWNFQPYAIGLAFCSIGFGYVLAWFSFFPAIERNKRQRAENPDDERVQYESRLWWLLYTAPCLPIGLIIFAWTSTGPPLHWIGSMIAACIVGIANYAIYMATIDYMICAYGPYSASATGGNGWARDFLAGVLTLPATPFFESKSWIRDSVIVYLLMFHVDIGDNPLAYASTILFCISALLVCAVYVIYYYGPTLRARSPFAQQLAGARQDRAPDQDGRRLSYFPSAGARKASRAFSGASEADAAAARARYSRTGSQARTAQARRVSQESGSRRSSLQEERRRGQV